MKKPGFIIDELHREAWESLPDERCGRLLKTLISYQFDGEIPTELSPDLRVAFSFLRPVADKHKAAYEAKCQQATRAANKRWNADECECIPPNVVHANRKDKK